MGAEIQKTGIFLCSPTENDNIARIMRDNYPYNENLILTSSKVTSGGQASGITSSYEADGRLKVIAASGNGNYRSLGFAKNSNTNVGNNMAVGDKYVVAFDIFIAEGSGIPTLFINGGNGYAGMNGNPNLIGAWQRVWKVRTWAAPGTNYGNISLHLGFSGLVGTYYFKNFKLEKGEVMTPWSPAPTDGWGPNVMALENPVEGFSFNEI